MKRWGSCFLIALFYLLKAEKGLDAGAQSDLLKIVG